MSFPRNTNPILKILLSLKLIAGCDRDLLGFPNISLWLQYGPSGLQGEGGGGWDGQAGGRGVAT